MNEYDIVARHTNDGRVERIHVEDGKIASVSEIKGETMKDITDSMLAAFNQTLVALSSLAKSCDSEGGGLTEEEVLEDLWANGDEIPDGHLETMVILSAWNEMMKFTDYYPAYGVYNPARGWTDETGAPFQKEEKIFAWMRPKFPIWIKEALEAEE